MKNYSYNSKSKEGVRLSNMLDFKFNGSVLDKDYNSRSFENYVVPSIMKCRVNKLRFLIPSNVCGIKRPKIELNADCEQAWGEFADDVDSLDFMHDEQELPVTYTQPIDDETYKLLIDAGMYNDKRFEDLMNKITAGEVFDADSDMDVSFLNAGELNSDEYLPFISVEPVRVYKEDIVLDEEQNTIHNLIRRSALLAIEIRREGYNTEQVVENEREIEPVFDKEFESVFDTEIEEGLEVDNDKLSTESELLDVEIDVTDAIKDTLNFEHTSEDDKIQKLKERDVLEKSYDEKEEETSLEDYDDEYEDDEFKSSLSDLEFEEEEDELDF